jgi:hypothetical protein
MIDAVLNVAVFAALVLCIVGFGAWAHKRREGPQYYPNANLCSIACRL